MLMMGCRRMIRASRLRRTVLFALAHGARNRSPPIRVTPLSRLLRRRREVAATMSEDRLHGRLDAGHRHGAWGAVVYLSLTFHCAPTTPASRTARPLQFSAAALRAVARKSVPPLAAAGGRVRDP
jgi:hypothetical protein